MLSGVGGAGDTPGPPGGGAIGGDSGRGRLIGNHRAVVHTAGATPHAEVEQRGVGRRFGWRGR